MEMVEITNIRYVVTLANFALECDDVIIPSFYLTNNVHLIVINPNTRQPYNDNLCSFHCLPV